MHGHIGGVEHDYSSQYTGERIASWASGGMLGLEFELGEPVFVPLAREQLRDETSRETEAKTMAPAVGVEWVSRRRTDGHS